MKRFKKRAIVVLAAGILIQLAALFGEHATEIPFVFKIIAPSYCHAEKGVETLKGKGSLEKDDEGFDEISGLLVKVYTKLCKTNLNPEYAEANIPIFNVNDIIIEGRGFALGKDVFRLSCSITNSVFFNSPDHVNWELGDLEKSVEQLKKPNLLFFCFGMFLLGTVLDVAAFFMEAKNSNEAVSNIQNSDKNQQTDSTEKAK